MTETSPSCDDGTARSWEKRIDKARHDLRNPLGEILGLSDLLQEEALAAGYQQLLPDFETIHHAALQMLIQVDQCLGLEVLKDNRAILNELIRTIQTMSDSIIEATAKLSESCDTLDRSSFGDDMISAISDAARQLGEIAPGLLSSLVETGPAEGVR